MQIQLWRLSGIFNENSVIRLNLSFKLIPAMRSFNLKLLCNLKKLIILTAFIFGFSPLFAQLNILVGYGVGYQSSSDIDLIIESHNEQNPWYHNDLNSVTFLHGMYFGLRQDWGTLKTTLCFRSSGQSLSADGVPPRGGDSFERELFFRNLHHKWGGLGWSDRWSLASGHWSLVSGVSRWLLAEGARSS